MWWWGSGGGVVVVGRGSVACFPCPEKKEI